MNEIPMVLEPVTSLHFHRNYRDESFYYVTWTQGREKVPAFLGELSKEPFASKPTQYVLLDYGLSDDEQNWEWVLYTTNKEAIAKQQEETSSQEITKVKITSFTLSSRNRAYGSYNNYALLIEISDDWKRMDIHFFEDFEHWASCVFTCWECGYLDELDITTW
jgi:hypothetical protein